VFDGLDGRRGMVGESALLLAVSYRLLPAALQYVVGIEVNSKSANASGHSGYI
jgi:hypothetical protein